MPASPKAPRFFEGKKLKQATQPMVASEPCDHRPEGSAEANPSRLTPTRRAFRQAERNGQTEQLPAPHEGHGQRHSHTQSRQEHDPAVPPRR